MSIFSIIQDIDPIKLPQIAIDDRKSYPIQPALWWYVCNKTVYFSSYSVNPRQTAGRYNRKEIPSDCTICFFPVGVEVLLSRLVRAWLNQNPGTMLNKDNGKVEAKHRRIEENDPFRWSDGGLVAIALPDHLKHQLEDYPKDEIDTIIAALEAYEPLKLHAKERARKEAEWQAYWHAERQRREEEEKKRNEELKELFQPHPLAVASLREQIEKQPWMYQEALDKEAQSMGFKDWADFETRDDDVPDIEDE